MADDLKNLRDRLIKGALAFFWAQEGDKDNLKDIAPDLDETTIRDIIGDLLDKTTKSTSEIVRSLGREIGMTFAAMLKEPLSQLAKSQKILISIELVPKAPAEEEAQKKKRAKPVKASAQSKEAPPKASAKTSSKKAPKASKTKKR